MTPPPYRVHDAEPATDATYALAEGPLWDHLRRLLWWVDIPHGTVHGGALVDGRRIVPSERIEVDETVGAVALADDGSLVVAGRHSVFAVSDGRRTELARLIEDGGRRRLNDGKCDPAGRFLVGTLNLGGPGAETLYRIEPDGHTVPVDTDLAMSNGLGWSPDGTVFYSVDTGRHVVWRRPYDATRGTWGDRELFTRVDDGSPDGLCVDRDGRVWLAVWGTGEVRAFGPDARQVAVVRVAAPYVSCPTFAGPDLDVLVITTAIDDLDERRRRAFPHSGALFTAAVGAVGRRTSPWRPSPPQAHTNPLSQHQDGK